MNCRPRRPRIWPCCAKPGRRDMSTLPSPALLAARERLRASREALHTALIPPPRHTAGQDAHSNWPGLALLNRSAAWRWLRRTGATWWRRHPLHGPAEALGDELGHQLRPLVQRHPAAAVLLAALAGAAVVAWRPWRQPWARQLVQPLRHSLPPGPAGWLPWLLRQVNQLPWQSTLAAWVALQAHRPPVEPAQPAAPASPGPQLDPRSPP